MAACTWAAGILVELMAHEYAISSLVRNYYYSFASIKKCSYFPPRWNEQHAMMIPHLLKLRKIIANAFRPISHCVSSGSKRFAIFAPVNRLKLITSPARCGSRLSCIYFGRVVYRRAANRYSTIYLLSEFGYFIIFTGDIVMGKLNLNFD